MYQRTILPATMKAVQAAASQGAGGAIPRGESLPQQKGNGMDISKLGGLMGLIRGMAPGTATGTPGGEAIPTRLGNLDSFGGTQDSGSTFGALDQLGTMGQTGAATPSSPGATGGTGLASPAGQYGVPENLGQALMNSQGYGFQTPGTPSYLQYLWHMQG